MPRKKQPINLALDPELLKKVDEWRKKQSPPGTKTWVFETAIREFLERKQKDE